MPTPVTIHAHLPPATEIRVKITDHGHTVEEFTLHDRGIICLGKAVADNNPDLIRYQCIHP